MDQTPFTYVYRMRNGFSRRTSNQNPAIRAASLAVGIVVFFAVLLVLIPLFLLFVVLFGVFWAIARVKALFQGKAKTKKEEHSARENVRVIDRGAGGDQSIGG